MVCIHVRTQAGVEEVAAARPDKPTNSLFFFTHIIQGENATPLLN